MVSKRDAVNSYKKRQGFQCPSCSAVIRKGISYCPQCGYTLFNDHVREARLLHDQKLPYWSYAGMLIWIWLASKLFDWYSMPGHFAFAPVGYPLAFILLYWSFKHFRIELVNVMYVKRSTTDLLLRLLLRLGVPVFTFIFMLHLIYLTFRIAHPAG